MALIFSSKAELITPVGVVGVVGPCILWKDKLSFEYGNNPLKTGDIIDTVCTQHLEKATWTDGKMCPAQCSVCFIYRGCITNVNTIKVLILINEIIDSLQNCLSLPRCQSKV